MRISLINRIVPLFLILMLLSLHSYAAGGGGGGGSSSGLGFGARDSVFILVSNTYSEKFSLKNGTKYDLKINADEERVNVNFGSLSIDLGEGDNFIDLNDNKLADINFKLETHSGIRANIRIINMKDAFTLREESSTIAEKMQIEENIEDDQEEESSEEGLKCGNLNTLKERVSCRLNLEEEEQEEELELYYLPEECRPLSGSIRGVCIARYKSVQTCWKFPIGDERISCAKRTIKLDDIWQEKKSCDEKTAQERASCINEIKNKVYNLIKWRFYDLEERSENFMTRGLIDRETVTEFIAKTEQNKIKFNEAKTKDERRDIILAVRNDWHDLVNTIKKNLRG